MILAQADITVSNPVAVYSVPASKSCVVTTILICNRGSSNTTFKLAFSKSGIGVSNAQYAYFNTPLTANDTVVLEFTALQLGSNDKIYFENSSKSVTVQIFGIEV